MSRRYNKKNFFSKFLLFLTLFLLGALLFSLLNQSKNSSPEVLVDSIQIVSSLCF